MKKVLWSILCGCIIVGAVGCGSKEELKCTAQEDGSTGTLVGTFEKGTLKKMTMETTTTYESEEDLESEYEMLQFTVGIFDAMDGAEGSLSKKDLSATMKITIDLNKMSSENIEDMFEKESMNKEEFKSYAEEQGFTCK